MKNEQQQNQGDKKLGPPTLEQVQKWTRHDLESAHYLLGMVLKLYPDIVDNLAQLLYDAAMRREEGAAIDHIPQKENGN